MAEFDTYVRDHPQTGERQERTPGTPAEEVALRFDGWRKASRKSSGAKSDSTGSGTKSTASGTTKSTSNS